MQVNKHIAEALVGIGLLVVAIGARPVFAQTPTETGPDDQVQAPSYPGSIVVDQTNLEGVSEADEAAALQGMATISADQAKSAAEAANPGATVVKVELDNENGVLVYSVELSNGLDVKVDAGNRTILHTEQADADHESGKGDVDNVQEEHEGQADDATEMSGVEDAVGQ